MLAAKVRLCSLAVADHIAEAIVHLSADGVSMIFRSHNQVRTVAEIFDGHLDLAASVDGVLDVRCHLLGSPFGLVLLTKESIAIVLKICQALLLYFSSFYLWVVLIFAI